MEKFILQGLPVLYHFFPGEPQGVYRGDFMLSNHSDEMIQLNIEKCEFLQNERSILLQSYSIYSDEMKLKTKIDIAPGIEITIRITFPEIAITQTRNCQYGIKIFVSCNDKIYEAISEMSIIHEENAED